MDGLLQPITYLAHLNSATRIAAHLWFGKNFRFGFSNKRCYCSARYYFLRNLCVRLKSSVQSPLVALFHCNSIWTGALLKCLIDDEWYIPWRSLPYDTRKLFWIILFSDQLFSIILYDHYSHASNLNDNNEIDYKITGLSNTPKQAL